MIKLPILTPTRLRMWTRCRRQYGYVEVMGIRSPPNWAMIGGIAMDQTLNEHHDTRIKSGHNGLVGSALTDYYRSTLAKVIESNNPGNDPDGEAQQAEIDGCKLLPIYERKIDPYVDPIATQVELEFEIPGNSYVQLFKMQGHMDMLSRTTLSTVIDDHKFTSRRPNGTACSSSMQMWGYDYAYGKSRGGWDNQLTRLIHLVRLKREPDVVTTSHIVTQENRNDFVMMAQEAAHQIQAGYFPPTDPGNIMVCGENQCGLWKMCRGRAGGMMPIPGEITFGNQTNPVS